MSKLIKDMTLDELRNGYAELEFEVDMLRHKLEGCKVTQKDNLFRDALIMANTRGRIKAHKSTSNGRMYSDLFGTGCGTGRSGARELGLDPDGNETDYSDMMEFIRGEPK